MAIEFFPQDSTSSGGIGASSAYCDLPFSESADKLILVITYRQYNGLSTTLNTPTVGATTADTIALGTGIGIFEFDGGLSGSANFTFSTNPSDFRARCMRMKGQKTASPYSAGYTANTFGLSHTIIAGTTAPNPGAVFFAVITCPTNTPYGEIFESPDNLIAEPGEMFDVPLGWEPHSSLSLAVRYAEEAGDVGSHTWNSRGYRNDVIGGFSISGAVVGFWIIPLQAPSAPIVTAPATNGKFTVGSTQTISWTGATDPNVDTEDLIYKVYKSADNGNSYTLLTTTAAGVLSYAWDTTGSTAGNYKIKVVANNGTDDGQPGYSGTFQLFADTAPSAPINLLPFGYISQAARTFTWQAVNPDFDTQSHYELEWDNDPAFGSSSTTGTVASTTSAHAFLASTDILSSLGTFYWRVRTKGAVDGTFGPWSATQTVIVAAAPATPTITSSNTATTAIWPVTFTAIAHTQFRHRWILSGTERFNGIVQSSAFAFSSPFTLANGEVWTLKVSVFDPTTGLESAEASQTLTVTYTGPATPTLAVTEVDGGFQLQVTNSVPSDIDHTRIYRSHNSGDYELASPKLGPNALYIDNHVANDLDDDYNAYSYKARSFKVTTLGYTDSLASSQVGVDLQYLYLHVVDRTSTTSNAGLKVRLDIEGEIIKKFVKNHRSVAFTGRTEFVTMAGQARHAELTYNVVIPRNDTTTFPALKACYDANATLCIKDPDHNLYFGRIPVLPREDDLATNRFSITFIEEDFREGYRR
jgi:hypothetical protein